MPRIARAPGNRNLRPVIGRPVAFYSYRGFIHDLAEPWPDDRCGSYAGSQAHRRAGETPCQSCLDAGAAYMDRYRKRARCVAGLGWPY